MTATVSQLRPPPTNFGRDCAGLMARTVAGEDYFHVSAFEGRLPRRQWEGIEPRTHLALARILSALDDAGVRATFFFLGWLAERSPALVREAHAARQEGGCHNYRHRFFF